MTFASTQFVSRWGWRVGIFLMIFAPIVNVGLGPYGDSLSLLCLVAVFWYLLRGESARVYFPAELRVPAVALATVAIYAVLASLLFSSEVGSIQTIVRPIRALLMYSGLCVFVIAYAASCGKQITSRIVVDVYLAIGAHAVLMVVQFVVPSVRDAIYPYTFANEALEYNQRFRMAGLTNGGGAQLSIFQSAGILLWPFVVVNLRSGLRRVVAHLIALCIVASLVLSGRSGSVVALSMLPLMTAVAVMSAPDRIRAVRRVAGIAASGLIVVVAVISLAKIELGGDLSYATTALNRSLDFLLSDRGLTNRDDARELFGAMYFLPESSRTMIFGDAFLFETFYQMERRVVDSDSGYIQFLFGYGLFGSALQYAVYCYFLVIAWRGRRLVPDLAGFSIVWTVTLLVFQAKEVLVFSRIGFSISVLFFAVIVLVRSRAIEFVTVPFRGHSPASAGVG